MILHIAALAAVAACVRAAVRRFFEYDEPADNCPTDPCPPEMDAAKLEEALNALADKRGLKWKTSIVDLLKTVDAPSRFVERDALWRGCGKSEVYRGSVDQNIELHKLVLEKLRLNGLALPK